MSNPSPKTPHQTPPPAPASASKLKASVRLLEGLERQIDAARGELESLENQLAAARKRRDGALAQFDADLRSAQELMLTSLRAYKENDAAARAKIAAKTKELEDALEPLYSAAESAETNKLMLESELSELIELIGDKDQELRTINSDIDARARDYRAMGDEVKKREAAIIELDASITDLKEEKVATIQELDTRVRELEDSIQSLVAERDELAAQTASAEEKLQKRIDQLRQVSGQDETMRKELANERMRLDKWERTLKAREITVSAGEAKIQQNAQLLNL